MAMSIEARSAREIAARRQRRVLFIVGSESPQRRQVADALRTLADDSREVLALSEVPLRTRRECSAVVILVDARLPEICSPHALSVFRAHDAATVILLAMCTGLRTAHQLAALARAGLDAFYILDGIDSLESLRRAVVARHLANALPWTLVHGVTPRRADAILSFCMRHGDRPHSVDHVARWFQWDRKTIYRRLKDQRLRPVGDLINLGRLLHAALRLDRSRAPIVRSRAPIVTIARVLLFDPPSSLRRLTKRETRCTPTQLRDRGAVNTTIAAFRTHLS